MFVRAFVTADRCGSCAFTFERGPGHWVGGNEINVVVTYPTAVVALAVPAVVWGASWITAAVGGVLAAVLGLALHRPARGLFFAIDYLIEPDWTGDDDERRGRGDGRSDDGGGAPAPSAGPDGGRARGAVVELPIPTPAPRIDVEPRPAPPRVPSAT